jgi:excinuclease ABC subunit C
LRLPSPADVANVAGIEWNESPGATPGLKGAEVIQAFVKHLPNQPGVYRMINEAGDVLYVGKARSLKKRVTNYAQGRGHSNRITRMIAQTANMEFVTTRTETEALLLEANLIKRLKPRFNVLMRDDKSFPYILVTGDHEAPAIFKHRGARSRKGSYFGPFASAGAVGRTINALQRAFLLRTCTDSVYESRTRPCLLYQIKRCAGPCTGEIDAEGYARLVGEAKDFLSGRSQAVKAQLATSHAGASEDLDFERAAIYRDRLSALSHVQSHQGINPQTVEEADVFAIHHDAGMACIQVFFFRTGQNWGNRAYFPKADPSLTPGEILGAFIGQFYDDKPTPRMILSRRFRGQAAARRGPFACAWSARSRSASRSAAKSANWSIRCSPMRARRMAGIWPKPPARHGFCKDLLKPSACPMLPGASRSTTTPTSWAPMLSAA